MKYLYKSHKSYICINTIFLESFRCFSPLNKLKILVEQYGVELHKFDNEIIETICRNGHLEALKYFAEECFIDIFNFKGFQEAIIGNNLNIIKYLFERGFSTEYINYYHNECLYPIIYNGRLEILKYLIEECQMYINFVYLLNELEEILKRGYIEFMQYLFEIVDFIHLDSYSKIVREYFCKDDQKNDRDKILNIFEKRILQEEKNILLGILLKPEQTKIPNDIIINNLIPFITG